MSPSPRPPTAPVLALFFRYMEERTSDDVRDALRKAIVFESSALANQQYDIQSLSRVVDGIDKWFDLRQFILAQLRKRRPRAALASVAAAGADGAGGRSGGGVGLALGAPSFADGGAFDVVAFARAGRG